MSLIKNGIKKRVEWCNHILHTQSHFKSSESTDLVLVEREDAH